MSKPIVVQTTKAVGSTPKGAELGFADEKAAVKVLGEDTFKITRFQDGSVYEAPKKPTAAKSEDKK